MTHLLAKITPRWVIELASKMLWLPRTIRKNSAAVVWRLMVWLDPSLVHNAAATRVAAASFVPSADISRAPASDERPTLLFNATSLITGAEALRLLICSIFETPTLSPGQQEIFADLSEQPALWGNRDKLVAAIRVRLLDAIQRGGASQRESVRNLTLLLSHEEKTHASMQAYLPEGHKGLSVIYWPNPDHKIYPTSLYETLPFVKRTPIFNRSSPIGSAGSCFAAEIAQRLQEDGYNYVVTEHDPVTPTSKISRSCTRWGAIFNTPAFRQLVEKAFGVRSLPKLLWSREQNGQTIYLDPFREAVEFASIEEFESTYVSHIEAARQAFLQSQLFIFTLGMNEVWRLKSDGSVFSRAPWRISPDLVDKQILTVEENVRELQQMLDLLRRYNQGIKIVLSVSPVPLHATFRGDDTHVITANCASKSTLRVVAEEFAARNKDVYYFPSYEVVMYCVKEAWEADQRHVNKAAVHQVMELFYKTFGE